MHAISLGNTVFEGGNTVYVFGEGGGGPVTLVDTGFDHAGVRAELESGLRDVGVDVTDVDRVLLTHHHADHAGLAGWIQGESDATVAAHVDDVALVSPDETTAAEVRQSRADHMAAWGVPEDRAAEALKAVETEVELRSEAVSIEAFREGDVIRAGSSELTVRHLPGHTAGHAGFVADGRLWSGDALLPGYTPNIGGADVRLENALDAYLETLQRIARFDMHTAWPGHRGRIDDPIGRVRATVTHHRDRTAQVVDVIRGDGPLDAWSVAGQVFGALDGVHILHGTGEAHAHLEHLRTSGIAACDGDEYTLEVADPDLDAVFPSL